MAYSRRFGYSQPLLAYAKTGEIALLGRENSVDFVLAPVIAVASTRPDLDMPTRVENAGWRRLRRGGRAFRFRRGPGKRPQFQGRPVDGQGIHFPGGVSSKGG